MTRHFIADIDFSENWVLCSCGERVVSVIAEERALASPAWNAHLNAMNQRDRLSSDALNKPPPYNRSKDWNGPISSKATATPRK
jgi:hypothetical protein